MLLKVYDVFVNKCKINVLGFFDLFFIGWEKVGDLIYDVCEYWKGIKSYSNIGCF